RLADDVLASGDLMGPVFRELGEAVRVHAEGSHSEEVGRGLLSVVGEFAQIAGWVASDAGLHGKAAETYELGVSAARQAGDRTLESHLAGSLAYQVANVGGPRGGRRAGRGGGGGGGRRAATGARLGVGPGRVGAGACR
ncbi:MAG TPA: hypothetical protein VHJ17_24720, partial [Thermomonospora sp.]|nr:hypothetical protein [Thermomonospora sp.]